MPIKKEFRIAENSEDFATWNWAQPEIDTDKISRNAAEAVMKELLDSATIQIETHKNKTVMTFCAFDFNVVLQFPLKPIIDYWVDVHSEYAGGKKISDPDDLAVCAVMLRDLESTCARLRKLLTA